MDQGTLTYEYNMLIIERTIAQSKQKLPAGKHTIQITETIPKPGAPALVRIDVDGSNVAVANVPRTVPGAFTASETLDVGADLGAPVSLGYAKRAPFAFNGIINRMLVELPD